MFGRSKWVEVYLGSQMNEFLRIKYVLQQNHIEYKTKTDSARGRTARGVIAGGNPFVANSAGANYQMYYIKVKKQDEQLARFLISKRQNTNSSYFQAFLFFSTLDKQRHLFPFCS